MSLFGNVIFIDNIANLLFAAFAVLTVGYAIKRITIKEISLGNAGIFIIALLFSVIGIVLFVQLILKLTKANMDEEKTKLVVKEDAAPAYAATYPIARIAVVPVSQFFIILL